MYLVLPFGLNSGPCAFTVVVKQLMRWAAPRQLILFQYLDDWLNLHHLSQAVETSTGQLVQLCLRLGFLVNGEKSELTPSQDIVFLGETRFPAGRGIFLGDQKVTDRVGPSRRSKRRRSARNEGGVTTGPAVGIIPRSWIPGTGVMASHLSWWTTPYALETGVEFRPPPISGDSLHGRLGGGWGKVCQGQLWSGR